jgi:hypothetical protein
VFRKGKQEKISQILEEQRNYNIELRVELDTK